MANQNKRDRNETDQSGRRDDLGTERNRDLIDDEEDRANRQREGNLGNERNRTGENVKNRGNQRDRGSERMPE